MSLHYTIQTRRGTCNLPWHIYAPPTDKHIIIIIIITVIIIIVILLLLTRSPPIP